LRQNIHRVAAFAMLLVASSQLSAQSGSFKCSCSVSLLNDGATHTEMDTVIVACVMAFSCVAKTETAEDAVHRVLSKSSILLPNVHGLVFPHLATLPKLQGTGILDDIKLRKMPCSKRIHFAEQTNAHRAQRDATL